MPPLSFECSWSIEIWVMWVDWVLSALGRVRFEWSGSIEFWILWVDWVLNALGRLSFWVPWWPRPTRMPRLIPRQVCDNHPTTISVSACVRACARVCVCVCVCCLRGCEAEIFAVVWPHGYIKIHWDCEVREEAQFQPHICSALIFHLLPPLLFLLRYIKRHRSTPGCVTGC